MAKMRVTATALPRSLERTGDRRVDQAQRNVHPIASALNANPLTPTVGRWIKGLTVTGGADTVIPHGLGRAPAGWVWTRVHTAVPAAYETVSDGNTLTLHNPSSTFTADIWIF